MTLTEKQKKVAKIAIPAIVVALIIIIALSGGKKSDKKNSDEVTMATAQSMQTVVENDFEYSFDGIRWNYAPTQSGDEKGAQTKVGFFFTNFTRHEGGTPVSFARPYHIGWYAGDCSIETEVASNTSISAYGNPLAFTQCVDTEKTTFIGLFQDGDMITAYSWNSTDDQPVFIREIDITTVVRPGTPTTIDAAGELEDPVVASGTTLRRRSGGGSDTQNI